MRDYLEELLDLLTQEDEEAADVWEAEAASLILPKTLDAEAPEGVLNVPEGVLELPEEMAAEEAGSAEGGERFWTGREPLLEPALELGEAEFEETECEETEIVPGLDGTLDQEAALSDSPGEMDEAFASGGKRPVMREDGSAEADTVLLEQARSRRRPVLPEQADFSRRRIWSGRQSRHRLWLRTAGAVPWRRLWPSPHGDRSLSPPRRQRGAAADKTLTGRSGRSGRIRPV